MKRTLTVAAAVAALVGGGVAAVAATTSTPHATCSHYPAITQVTGGSRIHITCTVPNPSPTATVTATQTVTVTADPSSTPAPTTAPSPTDPTSSPVAPSSSPTSTPTASGYSCTAALGGSCPQSNGYDDPSFSSLSNGYNTYVVNQDLGGGSDGGKQALSANSPSDWTVHSTIPNDGGRVQTFANAQQLFNSNPKTSDGTYPLSGLASLKVNYDETSPGSNGGANAYEFAPDIFFGNYPNDVMFWTDTNGRCNTGAYGPSLLGHFTMPDGTTWTAHRYDSTATTTGNTGAEIILIKDGAGGPGTCAQQPKGTVDIAAGLKWLSGQGFLPADPSIYIVQTGWEITQSSAADFTVHSMSVTTN